MMRDITFTIRDIPDGHASPVLDAMAAGLRDRASALRGSADTAERYREFGERDPASIAAIRGHADLLDMVAGQVAAHAAERTRVHAGEHRPLGEDDVQWIVNDNGELGVRIGDLFVFLYKGKSMQYSEPTDPTDPTDPERMWRPVGKREFGETCHPMRWWNAAGDLNDAAHGGPDADGVYRAGDGWEPLPRQHRRTGATMSQYDLKILTDATMRDGDGHVTAALAGLTAVVNGERLRDLVNHLGWLLQGKVTEVQTLRDNIHRLCPPELAAQIVQD